MAETRIVRISPNLCLVRGRDGAFLINTNDVFVGRSIMVYGEYCRDEGEGLRMLIKPGDTVIEAGANIGSHTVGLAKRVGPQGTVIAFEPQRACYALLQAQIALNELSNVFAFNEGVGDRPTTLYMPRLDYAQPGNFGGASLAEAPSPQHEAVSVIRLDDRFRDAKVHLIKIDVEGMEGQVIDGARELIAKSRPRFYLENDRVAKSPDLIRQLLDLRYRLWWHMPPLFSADNYFQVKDNIFGRFITSKNMIGIPAEDKTVEIRGLTEIMSPDAPHPSVAR
jgi:FkbM family methyltransferase